MKRTPLSIGSTIQAKGGSSYTYTIDRVIGDGASSIVYEAHYIDNAYGRHDVRIKECYPYASDIQRVGAELVWADVAVATDDKVAFTTAYHKLLDFQNTTKLRNSTAHIFDLCEANGTLYSVMDVNEGQTFDQDNSKSLSDILKTTLALARVVEKYHDNGYLHLDIKPSNFLVIPETRELVILFDVDSVTAIDDIKNGKVKCVPYSKGWAAPEQMQGKTDNLCPATDIYSIGAILFQKVMGRAVENEDIGVFADWEFDGEMFEDVNPAIKRLLRQIFRNTLAANIKRRYQTAKEVINALTDAIKSVEQEQYIESDLPILDVKFIGRTKELAEIDTKFKNGARAIFLHAFGGVGKTTLARKYAEIHENEYDAVVFKEYEQNLAKVIDDIYIYNESQEQTQDHKRAVKSLISKSKALLIIDNFDVEDDEDLKYILSLDCDIIFTSRNDYSQYYSSEKIDILELDYLAVEDLVQVFKNEYGKPITEDEEALIGDVIERFGYVTKLVPIIAKQIVASHITIQEFSNSITEDVFARFDEDNEDIRVTKNGKLIRTNSLVYIRALFNIAELNEKYKTTLKYLYLLRYHRCLTLAEYQLYTGEVSYDIINDLHFRNWISIDPLSHEITAHQLVYDLIEKDYYPTYSSVPGLTRYIDNCFELIKDNASLTNWDGIAPFTFALLVYVDIMGSEDYISRKQKISTLYAFMKKAFLEDSTKLSKLLFESPKESTYYFYTHGIFDMFDCFFDEEHNLAKSWIDKQLIKVEGMSVFYPNGTRVDFSNQEVDDVGSIANDENAAYYVASFEKKAKFLPCFIMRFYFDAQNQNDARGITWTQIEQLIYRSTSLYLDDSKGEINYLKECVDYLILLCNKPLYNKDYQLINASKETISLDMCNLITLQMIQDLMHTNAWNSDQRMYYYERAEELVVVLDNRHGKFGCYGKDEKYILEYSRFDGNDSFEQPTTHWTKQAEVWFSSLTEAISTSKDYYKIYRLILSCEFYANQSISKIAKIAKREFVHNIYNDGRLSETQKYELLFEYPVEQLSNLVKSMPRWDLGKNKKHYIHIVEMYENALLLFGKEIENYIYEGPSKIKTKLYECSTATRYLLGHDLFDFYGELERDISLSRLPGIVHTCSAIEIVRRYRNGNKAKSIKNKLLQLVPDIHESDYSKKDFRLIAFKMFKLADECKEDAIRLSSLRSDENVEQRWFLDLLQNEALTFEDREFIAKSFLDDYINMVALEAYEKIHKISTTNTGVIDKMERVLIEYRDDLLSATYDNHPYYETIFASYTAFERNLNEACIRSICPFWLSQFHGSSNPVINIGMCYLIAQTYNNIPYEKGLWGCALEDLIDENCENDYQLSKNDILEVLDNIIAISPEAKKEIDAYLEKYPLK